MKFHLGDAEIWDEPDTAAIIAEVEKYYGMAGQYGLTNGMFLSQLRPAIDFWQTTQLEWARAGQITWAEWQNIGSALGNACAQIAAIDKNFSYTDTYAQTLKTSVIRDVQTIIDVSRNVVTFGATWGLGAIAVALVLGAVAYGYAKGS